MLELAILGELDEPLHGYELRKRLSRTLGPVRRLSYGSLYPALHRLADRGLIRVVDGSVSGAGKERRSSRPATSSGAEKRQVVYQTTAVGRDYLSNALTGAAVDDESLGLTMGLMSRATPATRLTLLMQRRAQVLDRHDAGQKAKQSSDFWVRSKGELDSEQALSELSWIDRLIKSDPGLQTLTEDNPDNKVTN